MSRLALLVLAAVASAAVAAPLLSAVDAPRQVHVNFGNIDGTSMTVSWITTDTKESEVHYGTAGSSLSKVAKGADGASYNFVSQWENYTSGLIHHVTIEHLAFDTVYYYKCGYGDALSEVFSFKTPPPVSAASSIVINLIGDLGQTDDSAKTLKHITDDVTAHMTLLVGDLSYADSAEKSSAGRNCTQRRWDSWGDLIQPTFANQPLMVLPGNHEIEFEGAAPPSTQEQFLAYQSRFKMPFESCGAPSSLYYCIKAGPATIFMLNSYMDFNETSPQYKWVEEQLAKVSRKETPWLMVNMHAPWYNSDVHHHDEPEELGMRAAMEPLFAKYDVDVVFAGHVHAYERMYPVYNNQTKPGATTYINIGDGGNREGPATGYYPQPSWSAFREPIFGHGRLEIANASHAQFTWHKNIDAEPVVGDSVWLVHNTHLDNELTTGVTHFGGEYDGYIY